MQELYILGIGGHAKVIADIVKHDSTMSLKGFLLSPAFMSSPTFLDLPVLDINILSSLQDPHIVVAIGDNFLRMTVVKEVLKLNPRATFPNIIHRTSVIAFDSFPLLGQGNVFFAYSVVNSSSKIGNFCIFNTHSVLEHDCVIGDFSSLAPNVTIGGSSKIGSNSAICIGATMTNSVSIGDNCVIGGCSFVLDDVRDNSLAYGIPAKVIRQRAPNEEYL